MVLGRLVFKIKWFICITERFREKKESLKNQDMYGLTALDEDWVILNQMIKYYKYGFGRVTDYVNEEIRNQKISRSEGIEIIERYDGSCSDHCIESFVDT